MEFDFTLALTLGKTLAEIRALPNAEWVAWAAYLQRKHEAEEKALQKAQRRRGR